MTLVLAFESSCDETAVALVRDGRDVVASVVRSQVEELTDRRASAGRSLVRE